MPNHSTTTITLERPLTKEQIETLNNKFHNEIKEDDELYIDFHKITNNKTKMIKLAVSDNLIKALSWFYEQNYKNINLEEFYKLLEVKDYKAKLINDELLGVDDICAMYTEKGQPEPNPVYTIQDWYSYNNKNHGTKWNGYWLYIEPSAIRFSTAWDSPNDSIMIEILEIIRDVVGLTPEDFNQSVNVMVMHEDGPYSYINNEYRQYLLSLHGYNDELEELEHLGITAGLAKDEINFALNDIANDKDKSNLYTILNAVKEKLNEIDDKTLVKEITAFGINTDKGVVKYLNSPKINILNRHHLMTNASKYYIEYIRREIRSGLTKYADIPLEWSVDIELY